MDSLIYATGAIVLACMALLVACGTRDACDTSRERTAESRVSTNV